jgi:hypothetical protein
MFEESLKAMSESEVSRWGEGKVKSPFIPSLAAMLLLAMLLFPSVSSSTTVIAVDPEYSTFYTDATAVGDTFVVRVNITDVTDMFAYEVKIRFQNDTLRGLSASRPTGHFLEPTVSPSNYFVPVWQLKDDNATHQYYHLGYTLLAPETGETGSGVLIEIEFQILKAPEGATPILSLIDLFDTKVSNTVPAAVEHEARDGYFEFIWAAPTTLPHLSVESPLTVLGAGSPLVNTADAFFNVEVWVNDLHPDWWGVGFEFKLAYNQTLIDFASIRIAPWFNDSCTSAGYDAYLVPPVEGIRGDNLAYLLTAAVAVPPMPPCTWCGPPVYGSGALVEVTFEVLWQEEFPETAESPLDLYDIKFADNAADPIPHAPEEDGLARILGYIVGRNIDVYTQYLEPFGGQGPRNPSDAYAPQDQVCLYAEVTYNLDPIQNKAVDFGVQWPDGSILLTRTAITDINGIATVCFRIPWPDQISPENVFGLWNVTAIVDIANEVVNDTLALKVTWLMEIMALETVEELQKQKPAPLGEMWFDICWEVRSAQIRRAIIAVAVYDDLGVPIAWNCYVGNFSTAAICTPTVYCLNFTMHIPTWAYVGPATAYANIYTDYPQNGGHSYGPEVACHFRIVKP